MSDREFAELWANPRITLAAIGGQAGVSFSAVSYRARRLGLPPRKRGGQNKGKRKLIRCRCQNPRCMKLYEVAPIPPIPTHCVPSSSDRRQQ